MPDMKCPICRSNLHKINIIVSTCTNDKCKLWGSSIPNLVLCALAQAKQDLERTRKALDVAVDALQGIKNGKEPICLGTGMDINDALEQIESITKEQNNE